MDSGAVEDGAVDDGAVDDGAVDDGAVDDGSMQEPMTTTFHHGVNNYSGGLDTYILSADPDQRQDEKPTITWVGRQEGDNSRIRMALLKFTDIFGNGQNQIPVGATIVEATLIIHLSNMTGDPPGGIHDVTIEWDEAVTWNSFGDEPGAQPDEYGERFADAPVQPENMDYPISVTNSLQAWSAKPQDNHGWIIVPDSSVTGTAFVRAHDTSDAARRPRLIVMWTGPEPPT